MQRQNVRVILASEYPEVRDFLKGVVEEEGGSVIVGQAENATRALTLARKLRPDITIVDCYLPYTVGLDTVPLSRIAGLDTAQTISEEIPNARVILLPNLSREVLIEHGLATDTIAFFSRDIKGVSIAFKLRELFQDVVPPEALVFADIEVKARVIPRQKSAELVEKALFFGGLGIAAGWLLIITMMFAPAGVVLAIAGAVTVLLGLAVMAGLVILLVLILITGPYSHFHLPN